MHYVYAYLGITNEGIILREIILYLERQGHRFMKENLLVYVDGKVCSDAELISDYGLEKIYRVDLAIKRLSGVEDIIAVHYSNSVTGELLRAGDYYSVEGDLRSVHVRGDRHGRLYIYASSLSLLDQEPRDYRNLVKGYGRLCCDPVFRTKRNDAKVAITDLMVGVSRGSNKWSYIPVVAWNSKARVCTLLRRGDVLCLEGRLQSHSRGILSREEVSIYKIDLVDAVD